VDNQINTTTGTLNIRSMFPNPDDKLYPNQFVNVHLLVDTMSDAVRVPVPAVQRGEPGTFVYVIKENNTVSVRPIKVGPTDGNFEAVLSGLQPGERVVTDGTDRLREGAPVSLPTAQQTAPGKTPTGKTPTGQTAPGQTAPGQTAPGQAGSATDAGRPNGQGSPGGPQSRTRPAQ
jgi:multidrug efflux system membrane fusion protein